MKTPPIPDKLFFKIGEVAELVDLEQHVLRYWEDEIECLNPKKNKSGQRLYQRRDVELIFEIKQLLYAEKFTVAGARKKLKQNNKKETQLDIAFDREGFVAWKDEIKQDLESILSILDKN
jgi:DNA-binding transcriptional MerR regulator